MKINGPFLYEIKGIPKETAPARGTGAVLAGLEVP
jgi:hypothetical protein